MANILITEDDALINNLIKNFCLVLHECETITINTLLINNCSRKFAKKQVKLVFQLYNKWKGQM